MLKSHKELTAYQKAYQLCLHIYENTRDFPKNEIYGLVSQMRRAAVSIPSNIAEGYSRKNRKEYIQFLRIASGSCAELDTQISLSIDLKLFQTNNGPVLISDTEEVGRLLNKLISSLEKSN